MRMPARSLTPLLAVLCLAACPAKRGDDPDRTAAGPSAAAAPAEKLAPVEVEPGESFRFVEAEPEDGAGAPRTYESPLSLTASDGTGLELVELEARGVLEPPLAFTELHLTFENPEPRTLEGRFSIALPQKASVSRFAMRIGERWQEAEVVERQAARRAYEDFLHRKQDPALLEQEAGNEFSARVFPIPANGRKEIVVAWSHELPRSDAPYVLPLRGLPELGRFTARVVGPQAPSDPETPAGAAPAQKVLTLEKTRWVPDQDLVLPQAGAAGRLGLRHENLVVARLRPVLDTPAEEIGSLAVLVDTSASRALGFSAQVKLVRALVDGLGAGAGPDTPLLIAAFDQGVEPLFAGRAGDLDRAVWRTLLERRALGASDLAGALGWLEGRARAAGTRYGRVLLVTDGVATAGAAEGDALRAAVTGLRAAEVERLDVLAVGGIRDDALLGRLVTAGLPRNGVVVTQEQSPVEVARRLTRGVRSGVKVEVEGARWVWPETLDSIQSGDEVLVYADLPADRPFAVTLGGLAMAADRRHLDPAERPLVERAWVGARIQRLIAQRDTVGAGDADLRAALARQVTELSVRHRVLSPYTAMLVLETEQDYARFGIDRRSLTDILTVGPAGIEVRARKGEVEKRRLQHVELLRPEARAKGEAAAARRRSAAARERRGAPDATAEEIVTGAAASDEARLDDEADAHALRRMRVEAQRAPRREVPAPPPPARLQRRKLSAASPPAAPATQVAPAMQPLPTTRVAPTQEGQRIPVLDQGPPPQAEPPALREAEAMTDDLGAPSGKPAYSGRFAAIMADLAEGRTAAALEAAQGWRDEAPGDVMALLALGEAFEAAGDLRQAARAYGSLIDLFPSRADLRRHAGQRLERLGSEAAEALAADTFARSVEQRPDHPAGHRLLAFALVKQGRHAEAFAALVAALERSYPERFRAIERILKEDLGLVAAVWAATEPARADEINRRLQAADGTPERHPSLRFVLYWETDANDVDFHIRDASGGHAYYSRPMLPSGGNLYADVTQGYGPECFTIRGDPARRPYPYRLQAHYYSRGPMGYGMGKLQVIEHDGRGGLRFEERPFVVMVDRAYVDLGLVKGALSAP